DGRKRATKIHGEPPYPRHRSGASTNDHTQLKMADRVSPQNRPETADFCGLASFAPTTLHLSIVRLPSRLVLSQDGRQHVPPPCKAWRGAWVDAMADAVWPSLQHLA